MRLGFAIFFALCFSHWGEASSRNLSLKEKIEVVRQIREQVMRNPSMDHSAPIGQYGKKATFPFSSRISKKDRLNIKMILGLPLENRKQALLRYGANSFIVLKNLVFSDKEKMPIRWKALISLARLYPEKSRPLVQNALYSSVWFLRNAGLIAMEIIDRKAGLRWAGDFLHDPSLVVRTAAVNMIKKHKASQYKIQLLGKLNAPDSFYKKKSLWIRYHIVSALAAFCEPGEEKMFISFLRDSDERLHPSAIVALEKLTGKTFRPSDEKQEKVAKTQKQMWMSWWSETHHDKDSAQL